MRQFELHMNIMVWKITASKWLWRRCLTRTTTRCLTRWMPPNTKDQKRPLKMVYFSETRWLLETRCLTINLEKNRKEKRMWPIQKNKRKTMKSLTGRRQQQVIDTQMRNVIKTRQSEAMSTRQINTAHWLDFAHFFQIYTLFRCAFEAGKRA